MEITQKHKSDVLIIYINGKLDAETAPEAEKTIFKIIDNGNLKIIINLGNTQYISSTGLRVMLTTAKKLKNIGFLRISNLNDIVEEIFQISGFNKILNVDSTEEEALEELNK
ncbi:MAG: STAS domain-containing protein [Caldisericia bacterium]|nr:STAS domain-containing protein [Caldisericia bacterium]